MDPSLPPESELAPAPSRLRRAIVGVAMMLPAAAFIAGMITFGNRGGSVRNAQGGLLYNLGGGLAAILVPVALFMAVFGLFRVLGAFGVGEKPPRPKG